MKERNQQTRAYTKNQAKRAQATPEPLDRRKALDAETQEQLSIGRKFMAEYREVFEKLAKG